MFFVSLHESKKLSLHSKTKGAGKKKYLFCFKDLWKRTLFLFEDKGLVKQINKQKYPETFVEIFSSTGHSFSFGSDEIFLRS